MRKIIVEGVVDLDDHGDWHDVPDEEILEWLEECTRRTVLASHSSSSGTHRRLTVEHINLRSC